MTGDRKRSLAFIVAAGLVAVSTILAGAYSLFDYAAEKRRMTDELIGLSSLQLQEIRVSLALPIWNIDRPQIGKVIDAMVKPHSAYGLRVIAAGQTFGRERDANWRLVPWSGKPLPPDLLVYDTPITFSGSHIGDARFYVTTRFLQDDLRTLRWRLIATVIAIDIILVLAVYLLVAVLVLRPIGSIERYAVAVSTGRKPDEPRGMPHAAELANLREAIETMVHQLDARHLELLAEMAKRAESEDRFMSIFESVNDAIMLRDPHDGAILEFNERTCEMFGYTREEMMSLRVGGLSSQQEGFDSQAALEVLRSATGEARLIEWQARHRDGHRFLIEINMRRADIAGEPRVILVARDITRRREIEEKLRIHERMSTIGSLVAGVAHEVRNPLFGISAAIDAFDAEFGMKEETSEYIATLRRDVTRLTRLMNELLEYGSPHQLNRHPQPVEPVISETLRVCTARARDRGISLVARIRADLPPVPMDADRMLQVLKNIVENALEFAGENGSVVVDARAEDHGAPALVLSVIDSGPGFRPEDLPHVFEPFFTRRRGGSGLGLAIVEKIVADHGGHLAAENVAGGGARVEIRLPLEESRVH